MSEAQAPSEKQGPSRTLRVLVIGVVATLVVVGLGLLALLVSQPHANVRQQRVDALARSRDQCVTCHRRTTPGIVEQFSHSTMAAAEVTCRHCHEVPARYAGSVEHEGTHVLAEPTPAACERCHTAEVRQYYQSRHSAPAYAAVKGVADLSEAQLALYRGIPEGSFAPDKARNDLYALEGPAITHFACLGCHNIGRPQPDGSVGECQQCHLRHAFSLEQARRPETCNACHIGPDHPQWEIYEESPHGIAYATGGHNWNWEAEAGTVTVSDLPAPTCSTCHMSGFGAVGTTHDVGDRLTWYLFASISERRPAWEDNAARMQSVCLSCHNKSFIARFYEAADDATEAVNAWVRESNDIIAPLKQRNLLTKAPFDQPIDYVHFEVWHHWGRTAKFGTWMQGPDYVQWHGAYEVLRGLTELRHMAEQMGAEGEARDPEPVNSPTPQRAVIDSAVPVGADPRPRSSLVNHIKLER